jgi:uncharacterized protein (DUF927 family)
LKILPTRIKAFIDSVEGTNGQVQRVAKRFGLVAVAGELATEKGITGWSKGEATKAAESCFTSWLADFGAGNKETEQILDTVRAFLERNSALFQPLETANCEPPRDTLGYIDRKSETPVYYVLPSQFHRIADGFGKQQVINVLLEGGWLKPGKDGKAQDRITPHGLKQIRIYRIQIV